MRKIYKITDNTGFLRYYILAPNYGDAEHQLMQYDGTLMDYTIEELSQDEMVWATENLQQNLYIFDIEYLDEILEKFSRQKYLISAANVAIASTIIQNQVGPSFLRIMTIERQTAILINNAVG